MQSRRVHYAWIVTALTFVAVLLPAFARGILTVTILPLEAEFGWPRWVVGAAAGLNVLLFGALGPFVAPAVARIGARRVLLTGLALSGASLALAPFVRDPWTFIAVWGLLGGFGSGLLGVVLAAAVVERWFESRRGLALGVLGAAIATAQLVFLPPAAWVVRAVGWRAGVGFAAALAVLGLLAAWRWMRDDPRDVGALPYGATAARAPASAAARAGPLRVLRESARSLAFWMLAVPFFICGLTTGGLIAVHLVPATHDHGIPQATSVLLLATIGVFDFAGSVAAGWASDRWHNGRLLAIYYGIRGASLLALPFALTAGVPALVVFSLVYGLGWVATVPPTSRLCGTFFGDRGSVVFGWVYTVHQVGAAVAALGAGLVRDVAGSYAPAFFVASAMAFAATAICLAIRAPPPAPTASPVPA